MSLRSVIRLAQLSDTHLVGESAPLPFGQDGAASLAAVVDAFESRPDVLVTTGDLAEDGSVDAYRRVLAITAGLADEMHAVAGNHDDVASMNEVLGTAGAMRTVALSADWTMLLVNSQWEGNGAGRLDRETLTALDEGLAVTGHNVVVCMHHPPVSTCNDPYCRIVNAAETLRVLRRYRNVRLVLSGHLHRAFDSTQGGIRFLGAPSTCVQLTHGGIPHFSMTSAPPAARLIDLHGNGDITYRSVSAHYEHAGR